MTRFFLLLALFTRAFCSDRPDPIYFVTMRKSGTHLLEKYLSLLVSETEEQYKKVNDTIEKRYVRNIITKNCRLYFKHLCNESLGMPRFKDSTKIIFLIRDPRDVLMSAIHFIPKMPQQSSSSIFIKKWNKLSMEAKITSMITQKCPTRELELLLPKESLERNVMIPGMNVFVGQFEVAVECLLSMSNALLVRFEELIGEKGGGSAESQYLCMERIAEYIECPFDEEVYQKIAKDLHGASKTFRSGQIGSWKKYFTQEHKRLFKEHFGAVLIALGYEEDCDW